MYLSDFTINNKYAKRKKEENRKESFAEIVQRNKEHNLSILEKKAPWVLNDNVFMEHFDKAYELIDQKYFLPSMRSMQFAGKAAELNEARIYNCSYRPADSISVFSETMFLLLSGTGVGYSVQFHHVNKLPKVKKPGLPVKYLIEDSIQGWADAIKVLMKAYLVGNFMPTFDFSDIREKGTELITSGGKAPGPEPLKLCLFLIKEILDKVPVGNKLRPIDVHDILCHIADAVLAGGIRRAAMISLFSYWDTDMLNCKSGEWWMNNPQRGRSNNSAVLLRKNKNFVEKVKGLFLKRYKVVDKKQFDSIFNACRDSYAGEPGFFLTNDLELGTNPCGEISLYPYQFCNLIEVNGLMVNKNNQLPIAKFAALIGTIQSLHTDFYYLDRKWIDQTEKERLIGIGITGITSLDSTFNKTEFAEDIMYHNAIYAEKLKIAPAARCTTVKPSGTTSCVLSENEINCPSGIHAGYAEFFIRRARLNANDPLVPALLKAYPKALKVAGKTFKIIEQDNRDKNTYVISFPMKSVKNSTLRQDETAIDSLNRILDWSKNYIQIGHRSGENFNNVSCTINVQDHEWEDLRTAMWNSRNDWTAISLLPYDNGSYEQAPFEEVTEEVFYTMVEYIRSKKEFDFSKIEYIDDNTDYDLACSDGKCDINFDVKSTIDAKRNIEEAF